MARTRGPVHRRSELGVAVELYVTRILLVRDESKRQMSLDLTLTEGGT